MNRHDVYQHHSGREYRIVALPQDPDTGLFNRVVYRGDDNRDWCHTKADFEKEGRFTFLRNEGPSPSPKQSQDITERIRKIVQEAAYAAPEVRDQYYANKMAHLCGVVWDQAIERFG